MRAGVPNIVVPFTSDQPFWAHRVHALGVGPEPIPARRLTAKRLAEAIGTAVNDQVMRKRASELGQRIRADGGVSRAISIIQGYARSGR